MRDYSTTASTANTVEDNSIKISLVPRKSKKVHLIVEGRFNVSNVQMVKENCGKLLQHFDKVCIILKNIVEVDPEAVRMLHVLSSSSGLSKKTITVDSTI